MIGVPFLAMLVGFLVPLVNGLEVPKFCNNYYVEGVLSLPYAELQEPFTAYFDKENGRSRTDYYGDLYQVYQFGPKSSQNKQYGILYKLAYVPTYKATGAMAKRACFAAEGGIGATIDAQSVLPDLSNFVYDSTGSCPQTSQFRGSKCELWKNVFEMNDKKSIYKMWVARSSDNQPIPVYYYMLGYDSLLGSHFDRYDVAYSNYRINQANSSSFDVNQHQLECGPMPGPGDEQWSEGQKRLHMVVQNPIREYVSEPHNYQHVDHEFEQFNKDHGKPAADGNSDVAHKKRWFNFLHNIRFIRSKNRSNKQYQLRVNKFADHSKQDLRYLRGRLHSKGYNGGLDYAKYHNMTRLMMSNSLADRLPNDFDWRLRGAVTPVKDQAVCGSCWSFGTAGAIEGAYFVKTHHLVRLSQQQMIDCSWKYANNGCDGGEDFRAYNYIMDAGGLATEEEYGHYLGVDGKCHDRNVEKRVKLAGFYNVTSNNPSALKHALIKYGPVNVGIDASHQSFVFYSHGVYYEPKCMNGPDELDHQVLVVGYGQLDGHHYWLVKNSWSTYWGDDGYILMSTEKNNCGVMTVPTVPIIKGT